MFRTVAAVLLGLLAHEAYAVDATPHAASYTTALPAYEAFVNQWLAEKHAPSVTIAFFKDDTVWIRSFGYADVENHTPASPDSAYRFASVQKSMTAVAVLQLVEAGKLDLDADIRTYVPSFPPKQQVITARQLLSHLSGLPHYVNRDFEQHITTHKTVPEAIAIFENFDLVALPGTNYSYSSYGYNLLGAAIEGASKEPYASYMRRHVWEPAT